MCFKNPVEIRGLRNNLSFVNCQLRSRLPLVSTLKTGEMSDYYSTIAKTGEATESEQLGGKLGDKSQNPTGKIGLPLDF
jgi:hypothetical protein